jgi:hypothetical protein
VARDLPRAVAQAFLLANEPGFPPSQVAPSISSAGGAELSCRQTTGVSPKPNGSKSSLRRWRRAFFSLRSSGFPLRRIN